jgi:hypothetical protein
MLAQALVVGFELHLLIARDIELQAKVAALFLAPVLSVLSPDPARLLLLGRGVGGAHLFAQVPFLDFSAFQQLGQALGLRRIQPQIVLQLAQLAVVVGVPALRRFGYGEGNDGDGGERGQSREKAFEAGVQWNGLLSGRIRPFSL